jgi:hypothetical protein
MNQVLHRLTRNLGAVVQGTSQFCYHYCFKKLDIESVDALNAAYTDSSQVVVTPCCRTKIPKAHRAFGQRSELES